MIANRDNLTDASGTADLLADAAQRASSYLAGLPSRAVHADPAAIKRLAAFAESPLPDSGTAPKEVLAQLDALGSSATVASAGPRYFGFVIGGALPATVAASWLATAWDQNAFYSSMSPAAAHFEALALRWLTRLLGLPAGSAAAFVTGATLANFTGLAAARHALLRDEGWDVEAQGLFGAPPIDVLVGEEAHATVSKALGLLGLGRERVISIPADAQGRLDAGALPRSQRRCILIAQAGNVNTGASDPFEAICDWAAERAAWVHVDGAFGLWAAASEKHQHAVAGVARADSWATDAHKWLNVPYDSGIAFVRDADALEAAVSMTAAYLIQGEGRQPGRFTPESSRRARGFEVWAALQSLGRSGVGELIERTCRHAAVFAAALRAAGYKILNDVELNQVLVSFGSPERTRRVIAALQNDGTCWCGGTVWRGEPAMRISVSSWATTAADVERSLAAMLRIAAEER